MTKRDRLHVYISDPEAIKKAKGYDRAKYKNITEYITEAIKVFENDEKLLTEKMFKREMERLADRLEKKDGFISMPSLPNSKGVI